MMCQDDDSEKIPAEWLADFEAAARRPLRTRIRYAFIHTYKPVPDDEPFRAFDTMEEALSSVLDDSEGAGLGIVILVLRLKKIGLDEDSFDIDVENGETVARITVPF